MIAALLLGAMCSTRLTPVVAEVKQLPAYSQVRNATIEPMRTADFIGEMSIYYGKGAQNILAFAEPEALRAFVREDYLCVATQEELLQTVMHEFAHMLHIAWDEGRVSEFIYRNWPRKTDPPEDDPTDRMKSWRRANGR